MTNDLILEHHHRQMQMIHHYKELVKMIVI